MKKRVISIVGVIAIIAVFLLVGCLSCTNSTYYPIDGKEAINTGVINYQGYVVAEEYVIRNGETHTILYLRASSNKYKDMQIEVNNVMNINTTNDHWWTFEFTPTEISNVYTITKLVY